VAGLHAETEGAGPRVVLVHGFTQTGASWRPVADRLVGSYEVVRVDAPGHGRSADVTAGLVEGARLLGEVGGPSAYVGYSMGGRLALQLAVTEPERVERLVLLGATAGIDDPGERVARRSADEALAAGLERDGLDAFLSRWLALPLFAGLRREAAGLEDRRANTVAGLASSLRVAGTGTMDPPLWDRLGRLAMPVLVLAGEHDARFAALGRRLAEAVGANAAFAVVPGAGHAAHLERPDAFLALVEPFLAAPRSNLSWLPGHS